MSVSQCSQGSLHIVKPKHTPSNPKEPFFSFPKIVFACVTVMSLSWFYWIICFPSLHTLLSSVHEEWMMNTPLSTSPPSKYELQLLYVAPLHQIHFKFILTWQIPVNRQMNLAHRLGHSVLDCAKMKYLNGAKLYRNECIRDPTHSIISQMTGFNSVFNTNWDMKSKEWIGCFIASSPCSSQIIVH